MRLRPLLVGAPGVAALVATATPAAAIKFGEPDNGEERRRAVRAWRCTGTQMDADTFLIAGSSYIS